MSETKIHKFSNITFIRISELPDGERESFAAWMAHQTRPTVPDAPDAVFSHDYERWRRQQEGESVAWD